MSASSPEGWLGAAVRMTRLCLLAATACAGLLSLSVRAADGPWSQHRVRLVATFSKLEGPMSGDSAAGKVAPAGTVMRIISDSDDKYIVVIESLPPNQSVATVEVGAAYTASKSDFQSFYWELAPSAEGGRLGDMSLKNDTLVLRASASGFVAVGEPNGTPRRAGAGTKLEVMKEDGNDLIVLVTDKKNGDVQPRVLYRIRKDQLGEEYWWRRGWVSGPMVVPFKWRLSDKSLSGEAAIGPYLGYRFQPYWFDSTFIIAGTAGLSVVNANNGTGSSNNRPAVTVGLGLIMYTKDTVQVGAFWGQDRIGGTDGKNWAYEGKTWFSIAVGYNFLR